jgi:hypothetical protein
LACSPPSIHTTAFPSCASPRACSSVSPSARARPARDVAVVVEARHVLGAETTSVHIARPSAVVPMRSTFSRSDSRASFCQYASSCV